VLSLLARQILVVAPAGFACGYGLALLLDWVRP
jgi:hypothetical protein